MADRDRLAQLSLRLDEALSVLTAAPDFAKPARLRRVFEATRRLLMAPGGCAVLEQNAQKFELSGLFNGTDWAHPEILVPALTAQSLKSPVADTVLIEVISEMRMLAVAFNLFQHPTLSAEQARHHLIQVMALNLELLFATPTEAEREQQGRMAEATRAAFSYLADRLGYEHVLEQLVDEIWRILQQRPIQVDDIKLMVARIRDIRVNPAIDLGPGGQGADRLITSLYGTTQGCRDDPGEPVYQQRLDTMDTGALQSETSGFARAMHDTGLVSRYHAVLVRHLVTQPAYLLAEALGLSSTGRDCLLCYEELVHALIRESVFAGTAQAVYGLALLLERGILYQPPVAPALWRQLVLPLSSYSEARLMAAFGQEPGPRARLLEGIVCMLGQPLGVGQGNNPTCQSARALSMWAYNDPDYLLQMVVWAARDDEVIMHFEGQAISSRESASGVATKLPLDLDPLSLLVVPHLDRIYAEMGRRCVGREGDPHRWINPEFHGWWSGRGFQINVDVNTGKLDNLEQFLRHFYASYHPYYNGNQPLVHPQPAGIAVTDTAARFIGWHAITLLRVSLDPQGTMRVYFFNPNNDSGQNWGDGIVVSTASHGERQGESSLPLNEFASRLYIFHFDPLEPEALTDVPESELQGVIERVHRSWGADRLPAGDLQADHGHHEPALGKLQS